MTDTSRTLKIESSKAKLFGLVGLGLLMTAASIIAIFSPGIFSKLVGGFGTVFLGLCTSLAVSRLVNSRGPVITISPEGICDTRVAAALIPWSAVTRISTWSYGSQKCLVLAIKPSVDARLGLTRVARWTRGVNRALGADGLCITAVGLKIDHDTLLQTCQDYARQARDNELGHQSVVPPHHLDYT
jgi:hypothetical protein